MNSQELNLIFDPVNQRLTFVNEGMREGETYLVTKRNGQLVCEEGNIPTPWSPAPDPATGLVPCGCGGKGLFEGAYLDEEVSSSYRVCLSCAECGMSTAEYEYEQEAMRAWNTAMGWKGGAE